MTPTLRPVSYSAFLIMAISQYLPRSNLKEEGFVWEIMLEKAQSMWHAHTPHMLTNQKAGHVWA